MPFPGVNELDVHLPVALPPFTVTLFNVMIEVPPRVLILNPLALPVSVLVPSPNLSVWLPVNPVNVPSETCMRTAFVEVAPSELCGGSTIVIVPPLQLSAFDLICNKCAPAAVLDAAKPEFPSMFISPADWLNTALSPITMFPFIFSVPPEMVTEPLSVKRLFPPPVVPILTVPFESVNVPPVFTLIPFVAVETTFTVEPLAFMVPSMVIEPALFNEPAEAANVPPELMFKPLHVAV